MFNRSKYTEWYFQLVDSRKNMIRECFTEKHHIVPRSLGGRNEKNNIVHLTPREHYISHLLLLKMVDGHDKKKMGYALFAMRRSNTIEKRTNSRQYEKIRNKCREFFSGKNNPFYGKGLFGKDNPMSKPENYERFIQAVQSDDHRKKMSEIMSGVNNPFYGKVHKEKTRRRISEKRKQPIEVIFENGDRKIFDQYGDLGTFLKKSTHLGAKLCKDKHKDLWSKYKIKEITKCQK